MLRVEIKENRIHVGERFSVGFQRTLRIPDDGRVYPLPPGLGSFPLYRVEDFPVSTAPLRRMQGDYFICLYQREALWIGLQGAAWKPSALKIGVGDVNAISGQPWDRELHDDPQDYVVAPKQLWLDGINAGEGYIRQFVAMPLSGGYTVASQLGGNEEFSGIEILVFEPKPGRFPDTPPSVNRTELGALHSFALGDQATELGLAAGGKIKQKIYPDPYGIAAWDRANSGSARISLVNSDQFARLTGHAPPPTPISARTYIERGFPWFDLYDEAEHDVSPSKVLAEVKSVKEVDAAKGLLGEEEEGSDVPDSLITKIRGPNSGEH